MSEFNNRIAAQREILGYVNKKNWSEELFGLSSGAIDRWVNNNEIDCSSVLVKLVKECAEKLFFLSNKSQEQITEDYVLLSGNIHSLAEKIDAEITNLKLSEN